VFDQYRRQNIVHWEKQRDLKRFLRQTDYSFKISCQNGRIVELKFVNDNLDEKHLNDQFKEDLGGTTRKGKFDAAYTEQNLFFRSSKDKIQNNGG